jgi:hypothetical protein
MQRLGLGCRATCKSSATPYRVVTKQVAARITICARITLPCTQFIGSFFIGSYSHNKTKRTMVCTILWKKSSRQSELNATSPPFIDHRYLGDINSLTHSQIPSFSLPACSLLENDVWTRGFAVSSGRTERLGCG